MFGYLQERREQMLRRGLGAGLPSRDAASSAACQWQLPLPELYRFCMLDPPVCPRGHCSASDCSDDTDGSDDEEGGDDDDDISSEYIDALEAVRNHAAGSLKLALAGTYLRDVCFEQC